MGQLTKLASKTTPNVLDVGGLADWGKHMFNPKKPAVPPVTPMPDNTALEAARRRRLATILMRGGRDSTIMSDASLGG